MKSYLQKIGLFKQTLSNSDLLNPSKLYSKMYPNINPVANFSRLVKHDDVKKLTDITPRISDHTWYASLKTKGMVGNLMKQGRTSHHRTNNAFKLHETPGDYKKRLAFIADTICEKIQLHPEIDHISLQEAPIKEHYEYFKQILEKRLPNKWKFYNSEYGLLTIVNIEKYHCEEISNSINLTKEMDFGEKDNRYKEARFRSFKVIPANENPWVLTNIHIPYGNKGPALKNLIVNALKYHLTNLPEKGIKHVICGDWNATPEDLDTAYEEAAEEIKFLIQNDSRFNNHVNIDATLSSSVHGHQQALKPGQDKPNCITVDGILVINISHSYDYKNKYKHTNFTKDSSLGLAIALLSSMSLILTNSQKSKNNADENNQNEQLNKSNSQDLKKI